MAEKTAFQREIFADPSKIAQMCDYCLSEGYVTSKDEFKNAMYGRGDRNERLRTLMFEVYGRYDERQKQKKVVKEQRPAQAESIDVLAMAKGVGLSMVVGALSAGYGAMVALSIRNNQTPDSEYILPVGTVVAGIACVATGATGLVQIIRAHSRKK